MENHTDYHFTSQHILGLLFYAQLFCIFLDDLIHNKNISLYFAPFSTNAKVRKGKAVFIQERPPCFIARGSCTFRLFKGSWDSSIVSGVLLQSYLKGYCDSLDRHHLRLFLIRMTGLGSRAIHRSAAFYSSLVHSIFNLLCNNKKKFTFTHEHELQDLRVRKFTSSTLRSFERGSVPPESWTNTSNSYQDYQWILLLQCFFAKAEKGLVLEFKTYLKNSDHKSEMI